MSGYPVVDVAIGLSFVFLILSVFATSIVEAVAGLLSYRARSLEDWLAQNLSTKGDCQARAARQDGAERRIGQAIRGARRDGNGAGPDPRAGGREAHPGPPGRLRHDEGLVPAVVHPAGALRLGAPRARQSDERQALRGARARRTPRRTQKAINALPAGRAEEAALRPVDEADGDLAEVQARSWRSGTALAPTMIDRAGALIDDLPDGPIKKAMHSLWIEAGDDAAAFRNEAESWFDQAMQRLSGWYKRRTQVWLWAVGFVFAVALDVDAIRLANALWQDQTLRQLSCRSGAARTIRRGRMRRIS